MILKKSLSSVFILTFLAVPTMILAQDLKQENSISKNAGNLDTNKFAGLNFGTGVSLTIDTGHHDRIQQASVINGIVRIDKENNAVPRILFESHYFFLPNHGFFLGVKKDSWGHGPFVAFQPGSDNIIQAIGLGWMIGFKRLSSDLNSSSSFNLGIGAMCDPHVQIIGDGIEQDKPLPFGEEQVRLKETSQWGLVILVSFTF